MAINIFYLRRSYFVALFGFRNGAERENLVAGCDDFQQADMVGEPLSGAKKPAPQKEGQNVSPN
jgi:hypothetical protein